MIYGDKFSDYEIIAESKKDKRNDYDKLIELSKKNIDLEFKELDKRIKYFQDIFINILKNINEKNYKSTLDKALSKINSYKSSYNRDIEWNNLKSKYGDDIFDFKKFKFMYDTPENKSNVAYFEKELKKLKEINKNYEKTYKDMLKFSRDKYKEFKGKEILHYSPYDKGPIDDTEYEYDALEDIITSAYDIPHMLSIFMLRDFKSIFRALGRKDIDIYN